DGGSSTSAIRERVEAATKIAISNEEAADLKSALAGNFKTIYDPMSDAPEVLGQIMTNHTKTGFIGDNHSSDYVELAMLGPGSESLPTFMRNTDMHNFLLQAAGVEAGE